MKKSVFISVNSTGFFLGSRTQKKIKLAKQLSFNDENIVVFDNNVFIE